MPDSSPYVPGYRHDVFVSYAQVDNKPVGGTDGWVHTLVDNLKKQLSGQLGRDEWGDIWLDRRIGAGDAIPAEVQTALAGSALLVAILSEGYLESPWCTHERGSFLSGLQRPGSADGRILLAHKMDIARERQPEPFRGLKDVLFFERNRDGTTRTLGWPLPDPHNPEDRPYYQCIDDLARAIAQRLRVLREQSGAAPARAEVPDALARDSQAAAANPTGAGPDAVFLAETTPDLIHLRDKLTRQLEQSGVRVLPAGYYARGPDAFAAAMRRDLAASLLFVQILGPYASLPTPDLPKGYEGLQLDLAQQHGLPILRWHDPALDLSGIGRRDLFERAEITVCGFEDFTRQVEDQARRLRVRQTLEAPPDGDALVLISAADSDEETAYQLGDTLSKKGVGYEVASEQEVIDDLLHEQVYQGLMVIYGNCERDWAKARVRQCRSIMLRLKDRAPACAVYDQPRSGKPRLGIEFPNLHLLSELRALDFERYLQALRRTAAAA